MITKEDLKQEIEQIDSAYLELAFNLLKQFPHHQRIKPDALICSRAIDYANELEETEGKKLLTVLKKTGFLGSLPDISDLSVNYKEHLDWSDKI